MRKNEGFIELTEEELTEYTGGTSDKSGSFMHFVHMIISFFN